MNENKQKYTLKGLIDLIETWCLPSYEKLVPEARKEIKEYLEGMIIFRQEEFETKLENGEFHWKNGNVKWDKIKNYVSNINYTEGNKYE